MAERKELTKHIQVVEEKVWTGEVEAIPSGEDGVGQPLVGTLAKFYEAQARWGREISTEEHENMSLCQISMVVVRRGEWTLVEFQKVVSVGLPLNLRLLKSPLKWSEVN